MIAVVEDDESIVFPARASKAACKFGNQALDNRRLLIGASISCPALLPMPILLAVIGANSTLVSHRRSTVWLCWTSACKNSAGSGTIATFTNVSLTNAQTENVANAFAQQYFVCTGTDTTSKLTLAIGTNDSVNYSTSTYTTLGQDWANLTKSVVSANSQLSSQVTVWAANDIERWASGNGFYVPKR